MFCDKVQNNAGFSGRIFPGGGYAAYDYDAQGRRVRKNVNGTVSLYWYNGEDIVLETDGSGVEVARWTHGPGIDEPLKVRRSGQSYFYHEDGLGSIVLLTDSGKKVKNRYGYDAFGNMLTRIEAVANFFTYTGREWDEESGLYYYRARHYDPAAGRFLQSDPACPSASEMNRYAYVGNNPMRYKDPFGHAMDDATCNELYKGCIEDLTNAVFNDCLGGAPLWTSSELCFFGCVLALPAGVAGYGTCLSICGLAMVPVNYFYYRSCASKYDNWRRICGEIQENCLKKCQ